jgi:hypothetical protein
MIFSKHCRKSSMALSNPTSLTHTPCLLCSQDLQWYTTNWHWTVKLIESRGKAKTDSAVSALRREVAEVKHVGQSLDHHQPINVPTAGAQAFLMDYPQGEAEELDSPAVSALGVRSRKLSNALNGQSLSDQNFIISSSTVLRKAR